MTNALYALFRVSRKTGEMIRYPMEEYPPGEKDVIEKIAKETRLSIRGPAQKDEWETQCHPEVTELSVDLPIERPKV
jgi:hypothetical protein